MELINQNFVFCTQCGKKHETASKFCNSCGSALRKHELQGNDLEKDFHTSNHINSDYTEEEMNLFISKNQEFYLKKFDKINRTGNKKSWNWAAFFLGKYWMVYRKMYVEALLLYLFFIIISACNLVIGLIIRIVCMIGLPMFGNLLYLNHINRKFKEINCADRNLRETLIKKYGGTNILGSIVFYIVLNLIVIIIRNIIV